MGEKKRMLDDDENAYKVLAMLLEPIVSEEFRSMNEEAKKDSVIPGFLTENKGIIDQGFRRKGPFLNNRIRDWCNLRQSRYQGIRHDRWETHPTPKEKGTYLLHL